MQFAKAGPETSIGSNSGIGCPPLLALVFGEGVARSEEPGRMNARPEGAAGVPANKWAWERAFRDRSMADGLTPTAQHIGLLLSTYADGNGERIRPTVETLVRVSGRSRATVHS